ncbi:ATP-binding protein [Streptomyces sp. ISID311]|uniref:ATP-binding protein n=1 Tax=Streptomyces sp. ISID311 TaxID=2601673 RepID=UPI00164BCE36|nr:ATP-binding protein [Streptomyces sp. ISID311]
MYASSIDIDIDQNGAVTAVAQCGAGVDSKDNYSDPPAAELRPRAPKEEGARLLPHGPGAASTARRLTRSILEDWRVGEQETQAMLLVVSELMTNAVIHAKLPVCLRLHHQRTGCWVWVRLTDGGSARRSGVWTTSREGDDHGRGMNINEGLGEWHGTCSQAGGAPHSTRLPAAV